MNAFETPASHPQIRLIANAEGYPLSSPDPYDVRLTKEGRKQAIRKGAELLRRDAVQPNAQLEYSPTGLSLETMARVGSGYGQGLNRMLQGSVAVNALRFSDPGESPDETSDRIGTWMDQHAETLEPGNQVITFTAEDVIAHIVARIEGWNNFKRTTETRGIAPVSETQIEHTRAGWRVANFARPLSPRRPLSVDKTS